MDEAQAVHGPVWYPGLGWEVRCYFNSESAAQGFAVFAANGFKAHQVHPSPTLLWKPVGGGKSAGPLPPVQLMMIYGVDITSRDGVVEIEYSAVGRE